MITRRTFLGGTSCVLAGLGFAGTLPRVTAAEARLEGNVLRFGPEMEPLVRLLEDSPRERVLEEVAARIRKGVTYPEIVGALFLAGLRNIQPRPVGFKFHAVLVVNSAHLASLASPDSERWLPIFWAIDQFKNSQARDVKEGDWTLGKVDEPAVPGSGRARAALIEAMDNWDEAAADAAIVGMVRTAGADEIYEVLARYGARDFREIGHKEIYLANSYRMLSVMGWQYAEPVLRSVVYAMLDRDGAKENPAKADLPADRPYRKNLERVKEIKSGWMDGKVSADATRELLAVIRDGAAVDTSAKVVELLNKGVSPQSIWDGIFDGAGELLMRQPGILALHATTFSNATHYSFQRCRDDHTRKLLLLQNAAFMPLFRGNSKDKGLHIDSLEPLEAKAGAEGVEDIYADISKDKLVAARKILGWLKAEGDPKLLADAGRRLIFLKGRDSHDYKFSAAVMEDYKALAPMWRDRYLAASAFFLRGSGDSENELVKRTRAALA